MTSWRSWTRNDTISAMFWDKLFKLTATEVAAPNVSSLGSDGRRQILPNSDLNFLLEQERGWADLRGREFSLLLYECRGNAPNQARCQELWQVIVSRVRSTDKAGWMSEGRLGIVLPETSFAGARKLAEDIGRLGESAQSDFSYKIYTYQPQSAENSPGRSRGDGGIDEILE